MSNIRLFVDCHVFDDIFQGTRTFLSGLYKRVIETNPDILFFLGSFDKENLIKEFGNRENVCFVRYWSKNKYIRLGLDIPVIIKKYKINIAHYQYITPFFKNSRQILTIHDLLFLDFPNLFPSWYKVRNRMLFSYSAMRADFITTVSEYSKASICKHFGIRDEKIEIIRDGIGEGFMKDESDIPGIKQKYGIDSFILSVGRIEPRKNYYQLLRAFDELELSKRGFKLVIIGSGSLTERQLSGYYSTLTDQAKASILFLNDISEEDLQGLYHYCSLFVFPSLAEGFGIPPLEASASGASVICSGVTAMSEFGFPKERLFDPSDLEDLKEKIDYFLKYPDEKRMEMTMAVRQKYSFNEPAGKFSEYIRMICKA